MQNLDLGGPLLITTALASVHLLVRVFKSLLPTTFSFKRLQGGHYCCCIHCMNGGLPFWPLLQACHMELN